jgi:glutathione-specific gamma-glutamylcyclotransferase
MSIALNRELVAKVHRPVVDHGSRPGVAYLDEADYAGMANQILRTWNAAEGFWVFAYGSLIWKPAFAAIDERRVTVPGWHRAFALRLTRWRGTPECPGLMLTLDRGGSCHGIAYRMAEQNLRQTLIHLLQREMTAKPSTMAARWVSARMADGPLRALAFTVDRKGPAYAGDLPEDHVVDTLSTAVGHWGSCAEYLLNTVENLDRQGIRDGMLWRLQARVAERIASRHAQPSSPVAHCVGDAR